MQIWDTTGQETFKSMNKMYFRGSHGVVLVCDMCDLDSFNDLDSWLRDFIDNNDRGDISDVAFILLGNKLDIAKTKQTSDLSAKGSSGYTKNRRDAKSSTASSQCVTEEDLQKWCSI